MLVVKANEIVLLLTALTMDHVRTQHITCQPRKNEISTCGRTLKIGQILFSRNNNIINTVHNTNTMLNTCRIRDANLVKHNT